VFIIYNFLHVFPFHTRVYQTSSTILPLSCASLTQKIEMTTKVIFYLP